MSHPALDPASLAACVLDSVPDENPLPGQAPRGERLHPPKRRRSSTVKFKIAGTSVYVIFGTMPDGSVCELFISVSKVGTALRGLLDTTARTASLYLQLGGDPNELITQWRHTHFEPCGIVEGPDNVTSATSIVDALAQYLEIEIDRKD